MTSTKAKIKRRLKAPEALRAAAARSERGEDHVKALAEEMVRQVEEEVDAGDLRLRLARDRAGLAELLRMLGEHHRRALPDGPMGLAQDDAATGGALVMRQIKTLVEDLDIGTCRAAEVVAAVRRRQDEETA